MPQRPQRPDYLQVTMARRLGIVTILFTAVIFFSRSITAVSWRHKRITGIIELSILLQQIPSNHRRPFHRSTYNDVFDYRVRSGEDNYTKL